MRDCVSRLVRIALCMLLPLPAAAAAPGDFNVYWGDLHGHTMEPPVELSPTIIANYYKYARDVAGLNYVALTEKDFDLSDTEWSQVQTEVAHYNSSNFVVFGGFEWGDEAYDAFGHRPVYYNNPYQALLRSDVPATDHVSELLERVSTTTDGLTSAAHPDLSNYKTDWDFFDGSVDRVAEIYSRHGQYEEGDNGLQQALARGFRFGFVGASDTREGTPGSHGLTAILASSLTRTKLIDAIRARRVYATTGARIRLWFAADGKEMGREFATASAPTFTVECTPTAPLVSIEILKNNVVVYNWSPSGSTAASKPWLGSEGDLGDIAWTAPDYDASNWDVADLGTLEASPRSGPIRRLRTTVRRSSANGHVMLRTDLPGNYRLWVNGDLLVDTRTLQHDAVSGPHDCFAPDGHDLAGSAERFQQLGFYDFTSLGAKLFDDRENVVALEYEGSGVPTSGEPLLQLSSPTTMAPVQLTWADNNFTGPAFYYLRVTQSDGHQAWASPIWVDRLAPDVTPPASPDELTANKDGGDVFLDWPKVAKDVDGNLETVSFYRVFRGTQADFVPDRVSFSNQIATPTSSSYRDRNALGAAGNYFYRVTAVDAAGNESPSHSNLAFKVRKSFTYASNRSNLFWIAVPWQSLANTASKLARDLNDGTSGPVSKVVRWDVGTQSPQTWVYYNGQWVGTNFSVVPGQAVAVAIQSSLDAVLVGAHDRGSAVRLTPLVGTSSLTWVSVPLTSQYFFASSIVNDMNQGVFPAVVRRIVRFTTNQAYQTYEWNGSSWGGTNFVVVPGDGYAVQVQATADWVPSTLD